MLYDLNGIAVSAALTDLTDDGCIRLEIVQWPSCKINNDSVGPLFRAASGTIAISNKRLQCTPGVLPGYVLVAKTKAVGKRPMVTLLYWLLRFPEGNNVVVGFRVGGDFNQHDLAVRPSLPWRNPRTGPFVISSLGVLKLVKLGIPLHQTEASQAINLKVAEPEARWVRQRAPQPFARALVMNQQSA